MHSTQTYNMKFGVVVFPGSNCDRDMHDALKYDLGQEVIMLWHKDKDLSMFNTEDCIILPGGFSYGDYLRCGAIARFSPMMQSVIDFANAGGKVFGVCNGFQIFANHIFCPVHCCATVISSLSVKMFFLQMKLVKFIKYQLLMVKAAIMQMKKHLINWKQRAGDILLL